MRNKLILLSTLLIFQKLNAQLALIKDPDGFCNIRESSSIQSTIRDTISNNCLVFVFEEGAEGNWLLIDYKKKDQTLSGYVHKSRIVFLSALAKFNVSALRDSILKLNLNNMQVTIKTGKFTGTGRRITFEKGENGRKYVEGVDGKFPWGTDGNVPRYEYKLIQVKSGNHTFTLPKTRFNDLFEPNLDMTTAYFDKATNTIYIEAMNSDAAGGYVSVWVLKNLKITQREIFIPF
jgi:hypothetical protein